MRDLAKEKASAKAQEKADSEAVAPIKLSFNVGEAAKMLGVSKSAIYHRIWRRHAAVAHDLGRVVLLRQDSLNGWWPTPR